MIHFEGTRTFAHSGQTVFDKLGSAAFLVGCLSNVTEVVEAGADRAVWKLRPGFAFIRGTLEISMDIVERVPTSSIRVKIFSKGIGATTTVLSQLQLTTAESTTTVTWSADITEITGLLKMVPKGLIQSAAGKVIEETWQNIEAALAKS